MAKRTMGSRILSLVLSFALVFTMAIQGMGSGLPAEAASVYTNENLALNPSFEETDPLPEGGLPSGQQRGNWYAFSGAEKTQEEAHTGEYSGMLPQTDAALEQDIPGLQEGVTYVFSVWAKVNTVASGASARIGVKNYGGDQQVIEVQSTEWQEYSIEFTYSGSQDARLFGYMRNASGGTILYMDDISLTVKSDVATAAIEDGKLSVGFADAYPGTPSADDFSANYTSSIAYGEVKELPLPQA